MPPSWTTLGIYFIIKPNTMLFKQMIRPVDIKKIVIYLDDLEEIACNPNKLIRTQNIFTTIKGN